MWFQVVWQILVYDSFNTLRQVDKGPLFKIWAGSFGLARDSAEKEADKLLLSKQLNKKSGDMFVAKVLTLIDEHGVRHQLQER